MSLIYCAWGGGNADPSHRAEKSSTRNVQYLVPSLPMLTERQHIILFAVLVSLLAAHMTQPSSRWSHSSARQLAKPTGSSGTHAHVGRSCFATIPGRGESLGHNAWRGSPAKVLGV